MKNFTNFAAVLLALFFLISCTSPMVSPPNVVLNPTLAPAATLSPPTAVPTNTPAPTSTTAPTIAATKTITPTIAPTMTGTVVPTFTPAPSPTRIPTVAPTLKPNNIFYDGTGTPLVRMDYFRLAKDTYVYSPNERIQFLFQITNISGRDVWIPCVGALVNDFKSQCSWGDFTLTANQVITWDDVVLIGAPGKYIVFGGICFGKDRNACDTVRDRNGFADLSGWYTIEVK